MKEVTYTSTKLVPETSEEKAVVKSWGKLWSELGKDEKKHGGSVLRFGDWSGYRSSQQRITHVEKISPKEMAGDVGTVRFTDSTTMTVWQERLTRREILLRGITPKHSYKELIGKLIENGSGLYEV